MGGELGYKLVIFSHLSILGCLAEMWTHSYPKLLINFIEYCDYFWEAEKNGCCQIRIVSKHHYVTCESLDKFCASETQLFEFPCMAVKVLGPVLSGHLMVDVFGKIKIFNLI